MTTNTADNSKKYTRAQLGEYILRTPAVGPALALLAAILIFSLTTDTFLELDNLSLVVAQSLVIGTIALGQTLIILTAGIDLSCASIAVLATLVMADLAVGGMPGWVALLLGIALTSAIAALNGALITAIRLPPFIVTLGMFTIVTAVARIYSDGQSIPTTDGVLRWLSTQRYLFGGIPVTNGMTIALIMVLGLAYALAKTAWGKHVYAVGNDPEAARLSGISVRRTLLSVYIVAGVIYGIAAWQALGRVPNADPNAYQIGNLDAITAVVLGGTSLFGGRGSVLGTMIGALIVATLRSGLTQAGIDDLYQDVATGTLVIAAVALDRLSRRKQ
ncbi:monosaccharide ABC transporter membrane protein (CUT2 family) [Tamaricihabitans halophyticus]|uniref:Monosaccharide ABC transporter membrane protein (CUT2 family) n=1 Tax=Tamaricihabitans halophyticus TaxID=1262583 RepID=A0A4R2R5A8_9PSEU|nr:ABC transporter permease [Tamaricihabitans halophyticus]TCP57217.1 monosaccharide ABC transporter membrane protein (CUT2 family) [Tamaricihabitans halophyticus]